MDELKTIEGLEDYSNEILLNLVRNHINKSLQEGVDDDFEITTIGLFGSRINGNFKDNSDLDVVVEYKGNYREDDIFNALNDNHLMVNGIQFDFSPYSIDKGNSIGNKAFIKDMVTLYTDNTLSIEETLKTLDAFYEDCLTFWKQEIENKKKNGITLEKSAKEYALNDVKNIKHDPFSPKGKLLDSDSKEQWLNLALDFEKKQVFHEMLVEAIIEDEFKYCYDRSYMTNNSWEKQNENQTRNEAFFNVVKDVNNLTTLELLERYGDQYDYLYEQLRNGLNGYETEQEKLLNSKNYIIHDLRTDGFSHHQTIDGIFEMLKEDQLNRCSTEREKVFESHRLNLLSTTERKELIELYEYELEPISYDGIRFWENYTGREYFSDIKEITSEQANQIIDNRDDPENMGLFYVKNGTTFVGLDNLYSHANVEEFKSFEYCIEWLSNRDVTYEPAIDQQRWEESQKQPFEESVTKDKSILFQIIKKDYGNMHVRLLNGQMQESIEKELRNSISELDIYEKDEIDFHVKNGMDSKVSELEDTIDVYEVIYQSKYENKFDKDSHDSKKSSLQRYER